MLGLHAMLWTEVRPVLEPALAIKELAQLHESPLEELAIEALRFARLEEDDVGQCDGERHERDGVGFCEAEMKAPVAEAKHEESEPESEDHPEDIVALEDPNDWLGISPRVGLVVATFLSHPNNAWVMRGLRRSKFDAGIDPGACREEGVHDDKGQPAQARANKPVFQILRAPDHAHDSGHEQATKEEQDGNRVQHAGHRAQIRHQIPSSEDW